jgi:hypothetical protein
VTTATRDYDPLDLEGQQQANEEAKQHQLDALALELKDLRRVASEPYGRRHLSTLLTQLGRFDIALEIEPDAVDAERRLSALEMLEGRRRVGIRLEKLLRKHCPAQFLQMTQEELGCQ